MRIDPRDEELKESQDRHVQYIESMRQKIFDAEEERPEYSKGKGETSWFWNFKDSQELEYIYRSADFVSYGLSVNSIKSYDSHGEAVIHFSWHQIESMHADWEVGIGDHSDLFGPCCPECGDWIAVRVRGDDEYQYYTCMDSTCSRVDLDLDDISS